MPSPNLRPLGWFLVAVYLTVAAITLLLGEPTQLIAAG